MAGRTRTPVLTDAYSKSTQPVAGRAVLRAVSSEQFAAPVHEFVKLALTRAFCLDHDVVIVGFVRGVGLVPCGFSECHHRDPLRHL